MAEQLWGHFEKFVHCRQFTNFSNGPRICIWHTRRYSGAGWLLYNENGSSPTFTPTQPLI